MLDFLKKSLEQLLSRPDGPLHIRFVLQPAISILIASRKGYKDAKEHRDPFLTTLAFRGSERRRLVRQAWEDVGRVFLMACAVDGVYQLIEFHSLHPLQAVIVAAVLAILPYVLLRGIVTRLARMRFGRVKSGTPVRHLPGTGL